MKKILIFICLFFINFLFTNTGFATNFANPSVPVIENMKKNEGENHNIPYRSQDNTNTDGKNIDDKNNLGKSTFMVDTSFVTVGNANISGTGGVLANNFLGKIIKNLMILLGIISLVVISIGGYFMVSYGGDDSLLTKGKNAIQGGIISLIIAISSYYIVNIVTYVLYS